jgi:hypothetical protein
MGSNCDYKRPVRAQSGELRVEQSAFQEYLSLYGELNKLGQQILEKLAAGSPKNG